MLHYRDEEMVQEFNMCVKPRFHPKLGCKSKGGVCNVRLKGKIKLKWNYLWL